MEKHGLVYLLYAYKSMEIKEYIANLIYSRNKDYTVMHSFYLCALSPKTVALKKIKEEGKRIFKIFSNPTSFLSFQTTNPLNLLDIRTCLMEM